MIAMLIQAEKQKIEMLNSKKINHMIEFIKSEETLINGIRIDKMRDYQAQKFKDKLHEEDQKLHEKLKEKDQQYKGNVELLSELQKEKQKLINEFEKKVRLIKIEFDEGKIKLETQFPTPSSNNNHSFSLNNSILKSSSLMQSKTKEKKLFRNGSLSLTNRNSSPMSSPSIISPFNEKVIENRTFSSVSTVKIKSTRSPIAHYIMARDIMKGNDGITNTQDLMLNTINEGEQKNGIKDEPPIPKEFMIKKIQKSTINHSLLYI